VLGETLVPTPRTRPQLQRNVAFLLICSVILAKCQRQSENRQKPALWNWWLARVDRFGLPTVFVVDLLVANGSGGNPLSRPQPPEAVAEGQSLQGIASRPNSVTQSDVRGHFATTTIRRQHLHMQAWRGNDRQETANFKPMIFSEIHAAGDSMPAG